MLCGIEHRGDPSISIPIYASNPPLKKSTELKRPGKSVPFGDRDSLLGCAQASVAVS
jgi:hypothetical protein